MKFNKKTLLIGLALLTASQCDINITVSGDITGARTREAAYIPPTPTNVAVSVTANRELTITWNPSDRATGYYVYYSTTPGIDPLVTPKYTLQAGTTKVAGSLTNGIPYYFAVTAIGNSDESPLSAEVTATPILIAGTPSITSAVLSASGEITLSWTSVPDTNYYTVYYRTAAGVTTLNSTPANAGAATTLAIPGLLNNTAYYFRVTSTVQQADSSFNEGALSPEASAISYVAPATPGTPTVTQSVSGALDISWAAAANAASYKIYWSTTPGVTTANSFLSTAGTTVSHSGLTNGATYYYRVEAISGPYVSALSGESSAVVYYTPATPTGTGVVQSASGELTISWSPAANATDYNIYWATATGVTLGSASIPAVGATSYAHAGLTSGTTYYYRVEAVNPALVSGLSAEKSSLVYATPANPVLVSVTPTANNQLTISWAPAADATSYELYFATAVGVTTADSMISVAGTSYVHNGLTNGAAYFYAVRAVNPGFNSALSGELSNTVFVTPSQPTSVTVTRTASGQLTVSWPVSANADSYKIYWTTGATAVTTASSMITVAGGASTSTVHTGLTNATQYNYRVAAYNSACVTAGCPAAMAESALTTTGSQIAYVTPAAPVISAVTASGTNQLTISWNAVANAVAYRLWYSTPTGGTGTFLVGGTGTSYTHTGLTNATGYFYAVTAYSGPAAGSIAFESAKSAELSGTAYAVPGVPVITVTKGTNQNTITWGAAANATSYNLYWANAIGVTTGSAKITGVTSAYVHTGLTGGTAYYYRLESVNGPFVSTLSTEKSAVPLSPPVAPVIAGYLPVGPQYDILVTTVTGGGWGLCYNGTYNEFLTPTVLNDIVANRCTGAKLMLACRPVGSLIITLLGQAPKADATWVTPIDSTTVHPANGLDWYYNPNASTAWGFSAPGDGVTKSSCDTSTGLVPQARLCWHVNTTAGGFRCGTTTGLNSNASWERLIYHAN